MDKEDLIVCRTLQYLSAPVLTDFAKNYLRGGFKKFLKDTGQTFDVAKQLVMLTDGEPGDPKHHQPCPITGCASDDDSFYFRATDHTFHCPQCKFSGDIVDLIKRVQSKKSDIAKTASYFMVATRRKAKKAASGNPPKERESKKLEEAKEWLLIYFHACSGTIEFKNLQKRLRLPENRGKFSLSTIRKAADELGVDKDREGFGAKGKGYWTLPKAVWQNAYSSKKKGAP
ncbi:MAG: hypothetical protein FWD31_14430 [Planctomycetaceae bacterium]|nr:hypothetical protein [Planctomycetaceae bacterium]